MRNELKNGGEAPLYARTRKAPNSVFFVCQFKVVNKKFSVMHLSWPVELVGALLGPKVTHTNTRY